SCNVAYGLRHGSPPKCGLLSLGHDFGAPVGATPADALVLGQEKQIVRLHLLPAGGAVSIRENLAHQPVVDGFLPWRQAMLATGDDLADDAGTRVLDRLRLQEVLKVAAQVQSDLRGFDLRHKLTLS